MLPLRQPVSNKVFVLSRTSAALARLGDEEVKLEEVVAAGSESPVLSCVTGCSVDLRGMERLSPKDVTSKLLA